MQEYIQDETLNGINFSNAKKPVKEYDNCQFIQCDFSDTDLSDIVFMQCQFENCNLSSAKTKNTSFQEAVFKSCKMLGIQFDECNDFNLSMLFEKCVLDHCSFYQCNIKNTTFVGCQLKQADFSHADLSESVFDACDLSLTAFNKSNLQKVDFQTAFNFSIDPTKNNIKKAKFSLENIRYLLGCFEIEINP